MQREGVPHHKGSNSLERTRIRCRAAYENSLKDDSSS